jgi:hypothetical protein
MTANNVFGHLDASKQGLPPEEAQDKSKPDKNGEGEEDNEGEYMLAGEEPAFIKASDIAWIIACDVNKKSITTYAEGRKKLNELMAIFPDLVKTDVVGDVVEHPYIFLGFPSEEQRQKALENWDVVGGDLVAEASKVSAQKWITEKQVKLFGIPNHYTAAELTPILAKVFGKGKVPMFRTKRIPNAKTTLHVLTFASREPVEILAEYGFVRDNKALFSIIRANEFYDFNDPDSILYLTDIPHFAETLEIDQILRNRKMGIIRWARPKGVTNNGRFLKVWFRDRIVDLENYLPIERGDVRMMWVSSETPMCAECGMVEMDYDCAAARRTTYMRQLQPQQQNVTPPVPQPQPQRVLSERQKARFGGSEGAMAQFFASSVKTEEKRQTTEWASQVQNMRRQQDMHTKFRKMELVEKKTEQKAFGSNVSIKSDTEITNSDLAKFMMQASSRHDQFMHSQERAMAVQQETNQRLTAGISQVSSTVTVLVTEIRQGFQYLEESSAQIGSMLASATNQDFVRRPVIPASHEASSQNSPFFMQTSANADRKHTGSDMNSEQFKQQ